MSPWNIKCFEASDFNYSHLISSENTRSSIAETGKLIHGPQILKGSFNIEEEPLDTYLNTANWGKGVAFINDHNLGRYWPSEGPQVTLYVPAQYLRKGLNTIIFVELEHIPDNRTVSFQTTPILDYPSSKEKNALN